MTLDWHQTLLSGREWPETPDLAVFVYLSARITGMHSHAWFYWVLGMESSRGFMYARQILCLLNFGHSPLEISGASWTFISWVFTLGSGLSGTLTVSKRHFKLKLSDTEFFRSFPTCPLQPAPSHFLFNVWSHCSHSLWSHKSQLLLFFMISTKCVNTLPGLPSKYIQD